MNEKNKNSLIALGIIGVIVVIIGASGYFLFFKAKNFETTKNIRAKFSQAVKNDVFKKNNKKTEVSNKKVFSFADKEKTSQSPKIKEKVLGKNGLHKEYYNEGTIKSETNYENGKKSGKEIIYDKNGKILLERNYTENKLDGAVRHYENGNMVSEMNYEMGEKEGYWVEYYGIHEKTEGFYSNNKKNGTEKRYYDNKPLYEISYVNGKKEGQLKKWSMNGVLLLLGTYKNDLKEGEWTEFSDIYGQKLSFEVYSEGKILSSEKYFEDGKLKEKTSYINGKADGIKLIYSPEGKIISESPYSEGKLNGIQKNYYFTGELESTVPYKMGILDGESITYYKNGNVYEKGNYQNNTKVGIWHSYYNNGAINNIFTYNEYGNLDGMQVTYTATDFEFKKFFKRETEFKNGLRHGVMIFYYPKGNIREKGYFENDKKSGKWLEYFYDGKIMNEHNFLNDKFDGVQKTFYTNGNIESESVFREGKQKEITQYDIDGNVKYQKIYFN